MQTSQRLTTMAHLQVSTAQEGLNFKLAVFHPYDDLLAFLRDAQLTDITQCAWCDHAHAADTFALGAHP